MNMRSINFRRSPLLTLSLAAIVAAGPALPTHAGAQPPESTPSEKADIAAARSLSRAFQHVAKAAEPSVVHITSLQQVYTRRSMFEAPRRELAPGGLGSGVIVSADGYVLTNNHVVADAEQLRVRLSDGRELECTVVGADPATDLAVLKVDQLGLPALTFADSDTVEVGEWVVAIGSPFGFDSSVTAGIVSAKGRSGVVGARSRDGLYEEFIQTDAAINPGNSGGPLLNLDGQVVGINSAIITRTGGSIGLGFAIPSNMARAVMENIIDSGRPQRGYLGAGGVDLDQAMAASLAPDVTAGALINSVMPGSPADEAGLRTGDIVTSFGGKPVDSFNRLRNAIAFTPPGQEVPVEVVRNGKRRTLTAQVVDREEFLAAAFKEETIGELGITVTNAVRIGSRAGAEPDSEGVQVSSMSRSGPAFREGVRPGDLIIAADQTIVKNIAELKERLKAADWAKGVELEIERAGLGRGTVIITK
jgi:serine protease Do